MDIPTSEQAKSTPEQVEAVLIKQTSMPSQTLSVIEGAIGDDMSIIRKETITQSPRAAGFLSTPLQEMLIKVPSNDLNLIVKA